MFRHELRRETRQAESETVDHVRSSDEKQERLAWRPTLERHERIDGFPVDSSAEAVDGFGRIREHAARFHLLERGPQSGFDLFGGPERNRKGVDPHSGSVDSASARAKSGSSVTFIARSLPRTTTTGMPSRSQRAASSVALMLCARASRWARTMTLRGNPCGVCARQR